MYRFRPTYGHRVRVLTLLCAMACAMLPFFAFSGVASAATHNIVLGAGRQVGSGPRVFEIGLVSGPAGEELTGGFAFTGGPSNTNEWWVVKPTCLQVSGTDAIATGIVTQPESAAGQRVVMEAVDTSGTGPGLLRFSFQSNGGIVPGSSPACWLPIFPPVAIASGSIVVLP
jgi:hypothetical protein